MRIDALSAPLFVSWQLTRDCNLACIHCCTDSAPGKALPNELNRQEAVKLAQDIAVSGVPYVLLCGGEPLIVPHFFEIAEILGAAGIDLKIETNGQLFGPEQARRLKRFPIRSVQISLDGDTQAVYAKQRPGGDLMRAHLACMAAREAGLPLEVTFAPTKVNIHEAEAVLDRALSFGAFRFNTGALMRVGTAARLWDRIQPSAEDYAGLLALLERKEKEVDGKIELCYRPFTLEEGLRDAFTEPPATLQVLPDGKVKVSAPLPHLCADLRRQNLLEAWNAYRNAWRSATIRDAAQTILKEPARIAESNRWLALA
jgi:MoaA/NifB/PqqE/SkfB family radical SAM enzyme